MNTTSDLYAAPSLECDVVMKGGITSGVIYPRAVAELARTYRLRQVGGASAGAIAATAAAAAELGRATGGFEQLDRMPQDLSAVGADGRSTLATFFQPTRTAAPLFRLLHATGGKQGAGRWGAVAGALLRGFWVPAVLGALPGLALLTLSLLGGGMAQVAGLIGGALVLVLGVALAVVLAVMSTLGKVAADGFGLCTGMAGRDAGDAVPLTPWLHSKFQSLAGLDASAPPLTFGQLERHGIRLKVMTTNLTRHQPMAMPWATREFFFDPDEMRTLFPDDIVAWMVSHPPPVPDGASAGFRTLLLRAQAGGLRPWPAAGDLPVVVATRMSLSFPALISAVRLYAVDYTRPENRDARDRVPAWRREHPDADVEEAAKALPAPEFSSVWFTDGGLCANLPVHFFDTPLPKRPTFAFNLGPFPPGQEKSADQADNSYLPTDNRAGMQRPWFPLKTGGLGSWGAFGLLLVHTAREWVDGAQMVMPGYRDRIVTVHHDGSEGGMNLSMPEQVVTDLAERGRQGALKLADAFAGEQPGTVPAAGWDNHRWIRFRTATAGLAGWLAPFVANYHDDTSGGTPYDAMAGSGADAPLPSYKPSATDRTLINRRTTALVALGRDWTADDAMTASSTQSGPRLRLVPDDGTADGLEPEERQRRVETPD